MQLPTSAKDTSRSGPLFEQRTTSNELPRRTREIGVRVALGATRRNVLGLVIGEGLMLAAGGIAFGVPIALLIARQIAGRLHGVSAAAPVSILAAVTVMIATVIMASPRLGHRPDDGASVRVNNVTGAHSRVSQLPPKSDGDQGVRIRPAAAGQQRRAGHGSRGSRVGPPVFWDD